MRKAGGFTLTELVVILAVIAILTALALPNYQSFVMKSRRMEAKELLYEAAQRQQQFFTMFNVYTTNTGSLAVPTTSTNGYYTLGIAAGTTGNINTSYLLTATPVSGTSQAGDSDCYAFRLNSLGTKSNVDSGGTVITPPTPPCW